SQMARDEEAAPELRHQPGPESAIGPIGTSEEPRSAGLRAGTSEAAQAEDISDAAEVLHGSKMENTHADDVWRRARLSLTDQFMSWWEGWRDGRRGLPMLPAALMPDGTVP